MVMTYDEFAGRRLGADLDVDKFSIPQVQASNNLRAEAFKFSTMEVGQLAGSNNQDRRSYLQAAIQATGLSPETSVYVGEIAKTAALLYPGIRRRNG